VGRARARLRVERMTSRKAMIEVVMMVVCEYVSKILVGSGSLTGREEDKAICMARVVLCKRTKGALSQSVHSHC